MKRRFWLLAPLLGCALSAVAGHALPLDFQDTQTGGERMPFPGPRSRKLNPAVENVQCEGCHQEIAAEWRSSLHRQSDIDPIYRRALAIEPLAFCRGCHAPEANPSEDAPKELSELGIGCISCHIPEDGPILAAPHSSGEIAKPAPHPIRRSQAFASEAACAGCHEFSFPHDPRRKEKLLMQSTHSEHKSSPFAGTGCVDCHAPKIPNRHPSSGEGSHRSHAFVASRNPALLKAAASISASRKGNQIEVRIQPLALGHAFPTGDLFRRLSVSAEAVGVEEQVLAQSTKILGRHFAMDSQSHVKVMQSDDRVMPGQTRVVMLDLSREAQGKPIRWRVSYERVEHPSTVDNEGSAIVEGEVVLGEGEL